MLFGAPIDDAPGGGASQQSGFFGGRRDRDDEEFGIFGGFAGGEDALGSGSELLGGDGAEGGVFGEFDDTFGGDEYDPFAI